MDRMSAPVVVAHDPASRLFAPVRFGAAAARLGGAPLLIVSVHGRDSASEGAASDEAGSASREAAQAAIAELAHEVPELAGLEADLRAVEGHSAARGIHGVADEETAALVVIGVTGAGRAARGLVGSTAERVIHGAPCPVAVVPESFEPSGVTVVGVAFLPSPEGQEALHAGAMLARAAGAQLRVVALLKPEFGAVEGAHADPRGVRDNQRRGEAAVTHEEAMQAAVQDALGQVPEVRDVRVDVEFGEPEESLVDLSRHLDVLVMGSRGYGPAKAVLLGGVSRRVTAAAECPVLVIPRGAARPLDDMLAHADREHA
jgi:nucleotide-binding universal stress UspA family protein